MASTAPLHELVQSDDLISGRWQVDFETLDVSGVRMSDEEVRIGADKDDHSDLAVDVDKPMKLVQFLHQLDRQEIHRWIVDGHCRNAIVLVDMPCISGSGRCVNKLNANVEVADD